MSKLKIDLKALIVSLGLSFIPLSICFIGFNYACIVTGWGFNYWTIIFLVVGSFISYKIYSDFKGIC